MRFREFKTVLEFVQDQQVASDPAADLEYLITNTEISPAIRNLITKTVKSIVKQQDAQPQAPVEPQAQLEPPVQEPQQQVQTPQPKNPVGEPMGQDPEDEQRPMYEAARPQSEEAELLANIKSVKNKAELGK